jgi:hypothetical protein
MKLIYCVLGIIALYGCASVGTPIATQNIPKIRKGVTTEAELVQMFGPPLSKTTGSNGKTVEIWLHSSAQAKPATFIPIAGAFAGGATAQSEQLSATLQNGRVENYLFTQAHVGDN